MAKERKSELVQDLQDAFNQIENNRLNALSDLREIQVMSQFLLQHEASRLNLKLGQEHPQALQLEESLRRNADIIRGLEIELEVARINVPEVKENEALVHGRVLDENQRGLSDLTISLENKTGEPIHTLGTVETNSSGYYALRVAPSALDKLSEEETVFVVVRDHNGETVRRESVSLVLTEGSRVAMGITLKQDDTDTAWRERSATPSHPRKDEDEKDSEWVGRGQVTDENGQPVGGLLVKLYDKDRLYDDKLGAALTDTEGKFEIGYHVRDFREGDEPGPDLYLLVTDQEGNELYTSEKAVRFDAGRVATFDITIAGQESKPQADADSG